MDKGELELHAKLLERKFEQTRPADRYKLRSGVEQLIRKFNATKQPIPKPLSRLGEKLDEEAYDDMFDNMPV